MTSSGKNLQNRELINFIKERDLNQVQDLLSQLKNENKIDPELEILSSLLTYWQDKIKASSKLDDYPRSEFLLSHWKEFLNSSLAKNVSPCFLYALKIAIYNLALKGYIALYNLSENEDPQILCQLGLIYKGLGNYEQAIESFELALKFSPQEAKLMFLLADCYALTGSDLKARLFFREAFFLEPTAFNEIDFESALILELLKKLQTEAIPQNEICYWLPVYATIEGVFSIKRELKPVEIGRLSQAIFELEKQISLKKTGALKATLLYNYFWMADHLKTIKAPQDDLIELYKKIKRLDAKLFERYIL